ncbi:MAG: S-layer homology domain-containing protein, partial [Clostridiales bacterium]|nr:S-layer homology domain-containing protein [Clostridiales bacterium]
MMLGVFQTTALAAGYTDTTGHWAAEHIDKWSQGAKPVLYGYNPTTFGPDDPIKDIDLDLIIARVLGVSGPTWKDSPVLSREQAITKIARAFSIEPRNNIAPAESFLDHTDISADAAPYIYAMKSKGLISGMGGNTFSPQSDYTRAQALTVISNMIGDLADASGDLTASAYAKTVVVRHPDVEIENKAFDGDLIIGQGVGDGDITLDSVTVNGSLVVYGGGSNTIHIIGNSDINNVIGAKTTGQAAHLNIAYTANVGNVSVEDNSNIVVTGVVSNITIASNATLELNDNADIDNVNMEGSNSDVIVNSGAQAALVSVEGNGN